MLWYLKDVIEVMDKSGLILTREQAERIQESGHNFLTIYQKLAEMAFAAGVCSYKLRPKLHYFAHTVDEVTDTLENPRRQDLFLAEDFIGKVKRVGKKCSKRLVSLRAAQRRVIFMATKWAKMRGTHIN